MGTSLLSEVTVIQDTAKAVVDTVAVAQDSGFSFTGLVTVIVAAVVAAVTAYFGGKHGAAKGTSGR